MGGAADIARELIATVGRLSSLETRIQDVARYLERIEVKLDGLLDRLARVEADYKHLKDSMKNEIMADIKGDLREAKVYLDLKAKGLLISETKPANQPVDDRLRGK